MLKLPKLDKKTELTLKTIACDHLNVDTLDTRNRDGLDFHDLAVWNIKSALRAAYENGLKEGRKEVAQ